MKVEKLKQIKSLIISWGFEVVDQDLERPWGGFFVIHSDHAEKFVEQYFVEHKHKLPAKGQISPKFLIVEPGKRLSWQVHQRRAEAWLVVQGPVGAFISETDHHPETHIHLEVGQGIYMEAGVRHRLAGLDEWGVVAEIWIHTNKDHLSDEDDIRRIEDDFRR